MTDLLDRLQAAVGSRYVVESQLGRGGMGAVFLATDVKLDRQVAIKVLLPGEHDESLVNRFEQESRTAARLDHSGIIPIYAVESADDLHYFVMKYVRGRSLDDVLGQGALPIDMVQQVLWEAACALGHAHQRGVVHRDVKPANIMLDDQGRVLLADFGISKATQSASQLTATGQVIGTPHYMSPEQCRGEAVTGAADQYSLAVVGYRMLAGRLPFDDDSVHTIIYKHVFEPPPPIEDLRQDIPPFMATALTRALNKAPHDRFASMEALASAVWPERPVAGPDTLSSVASMPRGTPSSMSGPTEIVDTPPPPGARTRVTGTPSGPARRRWPWAAAVLVVVGAGAVIVSPAGVPVRERFFGQQDTTPTITPPVVGSGLTAARDTTRDVPLDTAQPAAQTPVVTAPDRQPTRPPPAAAQPQVGLLTVDATPSGIVYIDGRRMQDTPLANHELPVGRHIVEIRREGYVTRVDTVIISAGDPLRYRRTLVLMPSS